MTAVVVTHQEAIAAGAKTYFTGKPCKHGHVDRRRVSSRECVMCQELRRPEPTDADRERIRLWWKENAAKVDRKPDPESQRRRYKRYAEKNKDKVRERGREYYRRNREIIIAKASERQAKRFGYKGYKREDENDT